MPQFDKAVKLARCLGLTFEELCESFGVEPLPSQPSIPT